VQPCASALAQRSQHKLAMRELLFASELACTEHARGDACRYQVAWTINPHMVIGSVDFAVAAAQHDALLAALARAGATVARLPFVHGAFDSVFAKDAALLVARGGERRALLARPRHAERRCEIAARADALARLGFAPVVDDAAPCWEGGDVVVLPSGALLVGCGARSDRAAADWLARNAEQPATSLALRDPRLYHLDMALAILPDGTALACETAFAPDAMAALERARGVREVVTVPAEEALAFALNFVAIGDTIVCGARGRVTAAAIAARGFRIAHVPLDQFHRAGGGAGCLVARVHGEPQRIARVPDAAARSTVDLYGPVFRAVLFPAWETRVRRRPTIARWRELERRERASLDEQHAAQSRALARLVDHAFAHVPFYRDAWTALGIAPGDVRVPEDLQRLPIVRRADLQAAGTAWESTAPPLPTIRKQTSGTTGEPLLYGYEPDSEHWRRAVKLRGYAWAGHRPGDRALHFWGAPEPTPPRWPQRAKIALDRRMHRDRYIPCERMSDARLRLVVETIARARPHAIVCYAQAGAELARYIARNELRAWRTIPVICGAERLLPHDRADLVDAFGPAVFDTYGCREVMMIGAECEAHDGLHVAVENLVVEIVVTDPDGTTRAAREGETGEVVVTDLHNLAMPFVRYANGDIATVGNAKRCACGRTLPRIAAVQGRLSETLRARDGAPVSGIALSYLVQDVSKAVRRFQAVQHADRSMTIRIVLAEELPASALDDIRRNGAALLGGASVDVAIVSELPRSAAGKHALVVVER
jgi:phenylacetate-CoA ligase